MKMIKVSTKNEINKLLNLKKYQVLLLLSSVMGILSGGVGSVTKGFIGASSISTPFTVLSILTGIILPLIIAMLASDMFTAEQENGSIKASITRPISRMEIFISKLLAIVLYIIFSLLICLVASLVSNILFNGIGSINMIKMFLAYIVSIIPIIPIILFAIAISQLCKSSSTTVMLFILGYIAILAIATFIPSINPMVFTSYTSWYKLFIGAAMPIGNVLNVLILLIAYTLILFSVSSWAFEKKEY